MNSQSESEMKCPKQGFNEVPCQIAEESTVP